MKHIWMTLVLALPLCCTSCRGSGATEQWARGSDSDAVLESRLEILDPRTTGTGNVRALEFRLHNTSWDRLDFKYTVDWFDEKGRPVPLSSTAWHALGMDGRVSSSVRIAPMPNEAVSWRLRFRSAGGR